MTDLDTAALDGIAARAVAATPGIENRWRVMSSSRYGRADETEVDAGRFTWACRWAGPPAGAPEQVQADAAHIAGMDPATTLALVAEVRRLRDDVARVREVAWELQHRRRQSFEDALRANVADRILAALEGGR